MKITQTQDRTKVISGRIISKSEIKPNSIDITGGIIIDRNTQSDPIFWGGTYDPRLGIPIPKWKEDCIFVFIELDHPNSIVFSKSDKEEPHLALLGKIEQAIENK